MILHSKQNIADEIKRITNRRGVDVVFEHVGQATWEQSIRSMAIGGRLVTCGATTGYEGKIDLRNCLRGIYRFSGTYMGGKAELFDVIELVRQGKLKPVVDSVLRSMRPPLRRIDWRIASSLGRLC